MMKTITKILAALLLVFNGTGAVYGGYHLISHPDGSSMQMSTDYLRNAPFSDFLIPGIVLFTMNGLLSFVVLWLLLRNHRLAPKGVALQGVILCGWILVQIMMVSYVYYLHFVLGGCGIALILSGFYLEHLNDRNKRF